MGDIKRYTIYEKPIMMWVAKGVGASKDIGDNLDSIFDAMEPRRVNYAIPISLKLEKDGKDPVMIVLLDSGPHTLKIPEAEREIKTVIITTLSALERMVEELKRTMIEELKE